MAELATTAASGLVPALAALPAARPGDPEAFSALRRTALQHLATSGLPTRRDEAWRFTPLRSLPETPYLPAAVASLEVVPWRLETAQVIPVVNGRPDLRRLDKLPAGVTVSLLSEAMPGAPELDSTDEIRLDLHPFAAVNGAAFSDGLVIHIARGAVVETPIQVAYVSIAGDTPALVAPRTMVALEGGAEATVVETFAGGAGSTLTCPVTEIRLGDGARLRHLVVQDEHPEAAHLGLRRVRVGRDAAFSSHAVSLGARLARTEIDAELAGEGADCRLFGLALTDGEQLADSHIVVRHATPHCTSEQQYRGVLGGRSRGVFTGRIIVDPGAQKTDAIQSSRNLLRSDEALAHANPQLEIFADDVRCTHGSTVGRLDEQAVFYLRTRGIDRSAAEALLTFAFAQEALVRLPVAEVEARLRRELYDRLPHGALETF